jgi:hypothetical protein
MLTHTLPVGRKCSIRELYKKILLSAFVLYFYLKLQCFVVAVEYQSSTKDFLLQNWWNLSRAREWAPSLCTVEPRTSGPTIPTMWPPSGRVNHWLWVLGFRLVTVTHSSCFGSNIFAEAWLSKSVSETNAGSGSGAFLTPGSGIQDPEWVKIRIWIRDELPESYIRELRNNF